MRKTTNTIKKSQSRNPENMIYNKINSKTVNLNDNNITDDKDATVTAFNERSQLDHIDLLKSLYNSATNINNPGIINDKTRHKSKDSSILVSESKNTLKTEKSLKCNFII